MLEHHDKDTPFVQETTKISEIRDNFGKLRFKVFLVDMLDYYEETERDQRYRISVESYCYGMQPQIILTEFRKDFKVAQEFYKKCIQNYRDLVLAETKDFQDIKIYADRPNIQYHKIDPECCVNCKWSCPYKWSDYDHMHHHEGCCDGPIDLPRRDRKIRLQCLNHEMFKIPGRHIQDVEPEVDPNGICLQYCDKRKKWRDYCDENFKKRGED